MFRSRYLDICLVNRHIGNKRYLVSKPAKKNPKKYTSTINLPKTKFQVWVQPQRRCELDDHIQKVTNFSELYSWQRQNICNSKEYVLHDGPPYANGALHMGHAINKVLKDITIRHKLLQGFKIHYKPGWDCHGLPIELLALSKDGKTVGATLSPTEIRETARKFANAAIENQKTVFQSWGVMADWSKQGCYFTFDKEYVKNELMQFCDLFEKGLVYRDVKPVYWSPSSKTALAEAELEYNTEHVSTAVTLAVKILGKDNLYALLWTTTPWTLPANQAVAFNPTINYSLVEIAGYRNRQYIIAKEIVPQLSKLMRKTMKLVSSISVDELSRLKYEHPLSNCTGEKGEFMFLPSDHVTSDKGTGLVHIAPAYGEDDFKIGKKYGLNITGVLDNNGCFTSNAGEKLAGTYILDNDCTDKIFSCLRSDCILNTEKYKHSYPYDWRTNKPVILRTSLQWFIDTAKLKPIVIESLKNIHILPERNISGFQSMIETRPYWCISRQRFWGVPIPVLYNKLDDSPIISKSLIDIYCKLFDTHGPHFWWELSVEEIIPKHICDELKLDINNIEKGKDILDIWLDSGISWSYALGKEKVADLYLEGVDQFTGWFQSSLITSIALRGKSPFKAVLAHGFAVDGKGRKMSKSLGNIVSPHDIIHGGKNKEINKPQGLDVLRWWVAAHSLQHSSVPVSITHIDDSQQCIQKLRSILRFLLGGVNDIKGAIDVNKNDVRLFTLDKYILHQLYHFYKEMISLYNTYQYNKVCSHIINFVSGDISSLYILIVKDRLYCEDENSESRRAVQLTLLNVLNVLTNVIAPITPVLAEEVYMHHPLNKGDTLFRSSYKVCDESWDQPEVFRVMQTALEVKKAVSKESPINANNWKLSATIRSNPECFSLLKVLQNEEYSNDSELVELCQIESITLAKDDGLSGSCNESFSVDISPVSGLTCERCRRYIATLRDGDSDICHRCMDILSNDKLQRNKSSV